MTATILRRAHSPATRLAQSRTAWSQNERSCPHHKHPGEFERTVQLGPDVDPEKIKAEFKNGVLTVTVGKRPEAQRQVKRIGINA